MSPRWNLEAEECCRWCRQPAHLCREPACDDTPTYDGILRYGEWVELEMEEGSAVGRR